MTPVFTADGRGGEAGGVRVLAPIPSWEIIRAVGTMVFPRPRLALVFAAGYCRKRHNLDMMPSVSVPRVSMPCPLCASDGGLVIARGAFWRVVRADDQPDFPLTYRVIWNRHVPEFTDLSELERNECMSAVAAVERAMRQYLQPDKINLAELGNVVPHLHWHVIARYRADSRFPAPVWAPPAREVPPGYWEQFQTRRDLLDKALSGLAFHRKEEPGFHE